MKTVLTGAGVALVAGLLMGAVAQPDLANDDRPAGPQILVGWSGARSSGPFDDGQTFASYNGQIPDYVLGADWKRGLETPVAPPEPRVRETRMAQVEEPADLPLTPTTWRDEPAPEPVYPSLQGGGEVVTAPEATDPAAGDAG